LPLLSAKYPTVLPLVTAPVPALLVAINDVSDVSYHATMSGTLNGSRNPLSGSRLLFLAVRVGARRIVM
jgi:hypothetical protein